MSISTISNTLALMLTLATVACQTPPSESPDESSLPSGMLSEALVSTTSVVRAIDHETREVTLESRDGVRVTFRAGDEVRNLAQVAVGDEVTAQYYESVAYQVKQANSAAPGTSVEEGGAVARIGDKPGGEEFRVTVVTSTISAIDKRQATVILEDADGELTAVKVRDPAKLDLVAVGDLVEITLTEAVAVSVTATTHE